MKTKTGGRKNGEQVAKADKQKSEKVEIEESMEEGAVSKENVEDKAGEDDTESNPIESRMWKMILN